MKPVSPCKSCEKHPCKETKECKDRQDYADSFVGQDHMKAVDIDGSYRLLPM